MKVKWWAYPSQPIYAILCLRSWSCWAKGMWSKRVQYQKECFAWKSEMSKIFRTWGRIDEIRYLGSPCRKRWVFPLVYADQGQLTCETHRLGSTVARPKLKGIDGGLFVWVVCGESHMYCNEGIHFYTCSVVVGPTLLICSMIYGSTGAIHFYQLAKILTGYELTGAWSSGTLGKR